MDMDPTFAEMMYLLLESNPCCDKMEPPLFQCSWGHQYCSKCTKKSSRCFKVHSPERLRRSFFINKLCFDTPLKCSYFVGGCKVTGNAIVVAKHEEHCSFLPTPSSSNSNTEDRSVECTDEHEEASASNVAEESQNSAQSQHDAFLAAFKCPRCLGRIPLVAQCINEHRYCLQCFFRLKRCPKCRGEKSETCNMFLYYLLLGVKVPCNYANNGCVFRGYNYDVNRHENSCGFVTRSCPLIGICSWQGTESQLPSHCLENHPKVTSLESKHRWILKDFLLNQTRPTSCTLFCIGGVIFRCIWFKFHNEVRFSVNYYMGDDEDVHLYAYDINIFMSDCETVAVRRKHLCVRLTDEDIHSVESNYITFPLDVLVKCCDGNSHLTYDVLIL